MPLWDVRTRGAEEYADLYFAPRDHVVGVTGSAPARLQQGTLIRDALPTVEIVTLLAIMRIVAVAFRSWWRPSSRWSPPGSPTSRRCRRPAAATALFDLASPDELEPVIVALLLGVVTDYVVFFCSSLRDAVAEDGSAHVVTPTTSTRGCGRPPWRPSPGRVRSWRRGDGGHRRAPPPCSSRSRRSSGPSARRWPSP